MKKINGDGIWYMEKKMVCLGRSYCEVYEENKSGIRHSWRWEVHGSGQFSIKTAHKTLHDLFVNPIESNIPSTIWRVKILKKAIMCVWRLIKGILRIY